jgi:hypothetical protein
MAQQQQQSQQSQHSLDNALEFLFQQTSLTPQVKETLNTLREVGTCLDAQKYPIYVSRCLDGPHSLLKLIQLPSVRNDQKLRTQLFLTIHYIINDTPVQFLARYIKSLELACYQAFIHDNEDNVKCQAIDCLVKLHTKVFITNDTSTSDQNDGSSNDGTTSTNINAIPRFVQIQELQPHEWLPKIYRVINGLNSTSGTTFESTLYNALGWYFNLFFNDLCDYYRVDVVPSTSTLPLLNKITTDIIKHEDMGHNMGDNADDFDDFQTKQIQQNFEQQQMNELNQANNYDPHLDPTTVTMDIYSNSIPHQVLMMFSTYFQKVLSNMEHKLFYNKLIGKFDDPHLVLNGKDSKGNALVGGKVYKMFYESTDKTVIVSCLQCLMLLLSRSPERLLSFFEVHTQHKPKQMTDEDRLSLKNVLFSANNINSALNSINSDQNQSNSTNTKGLRGLRQNVKSEVGVKRDENDDHDDGTNTPPQSKIGSLTRKAGVGNASYLSTEERDSLKPEQYYTPEFALFNYIISNPLTAVTSLTYPTPFLNQPYNVAGQNNNNKATQPPVAKRTTSRRKATTMGDQDDDDFSEQFGSQSTNTNDTNSTTPTSQSQSNLFNNDTSTYSPDSLNNIIQASQYNQYSTYQTISIPFEPTSQVLQKLAFSTTERITFIVMALIHSEIYEASQEKGSKYSLLRHLISFLSYHMSLLGVHLLQYVNDIEKFFDQVFTLLESKTAKGASVRQDVKKLFLSLISCQANWTRVLTSLFIIFYNTNYKNLLQQQQQQQQQQTAITADNNDDGTNTTMTTSTKAPTSKTALLHQKRLQNQSILKEFINNHPSFLFSTKRSSQPSITMTFLATFLQAPRKTSDIAQRTLQGIWNILDNYTKSIDSPQLTQEPPSRYRLLSSVACFGYLSPLNTL